MNYFRWSDQGAFTGDMTSIRLKIPPNNGKRWFNGKKINEGCDEDTFGYLRALESDDSDSESEIEE